MQVVLVALDGVRYQEVFSGVDPELARKQGLPAARVVTAQALLPQLHALMSTHGAALGAPERGASMSASGPDFVSLPGYSEMLVGRRSTGCEDNGCRGTLAPSIADQLADHPSGLFSAAVIGSWPDIARVAARSGRVAVSAGRNGGATRSAFQRWPRSHAALLRAQELRPWPGHGDFRRDRSTADLASAYLEEASPDFLFVSLGEPDEFAHQGNYAGYLDALVHADQRIGELARILAARAARGVRTALLVTTDHGRAANFRDHGRPHAESARVWLVASGSAISARGLVDSPAARHLADLAPTVRHLFGTARDRSSEAGQPLTELLFVPAPPADGVRFDRRSP